MPVGPQLPPATLEKRKRSHDGDSESDGDSSSSTGPALPALEESAPKKARVIGPTLPPAPLETKPFQVPDEESNDDDGDSSDDDDFGPSLPPSKSLVTKPKTSQTNAEELKGETKGSAKTQRDDWMMVPPSSGDWSSRVDPTKLKNRKFNTGKSAKGPPPSNDAGNAWHETPAEKQARLQREMMGIKTSSPNPDTKVQNPRSEAETDTAKRMQEYNKSRGPTLYQSHQAEKTEQDDDPSARAFDREKDIGGGLQINATQRRDMMRKAADFGSRFSSAKYL